MKSISKYVLCCTLLGAACFFVIRSAILRSASRDLTDKSASLKRSAEVSKENERDLDHSRSQPEAKIEETLAKLRALVVSRSNPDDWIPHLIQLQDAMAESRAPYPRVLGVFRDRSAPPPLRYLVAIVLGTTFPESVRRELMIDRLVDSRFMLVSSLSLLARKHQIGSAYESKRMFWLSVFCDWDIGDLIAPGFRDTFRNRLLGLPHDSRTPPARGEGPTLPCDFSEQLRQLTGEDREICNLLIEHIRNDSRSAESSSIFQLLPEDEDKIALSRQLIQDSDIDPSLKRAVVNLLSVHDPQCILVAAMMQSSDQARADLLSQLPARKVDVVGALDAVTQRGGDFKNAFFAVVDNLATSSDRSHIDYIVRVIDTSTDDDLTLRAIAALGLPKMADPMQNYRVERLESILADGRGAVRAKTLRALSMLDSRKAFEHARKLSTSDPDPDVRQLARKIIDDFRD